ncbi:gfo/Idh/MocA family oxidoreductase [Bacillus sp. FJAT-42376]|uniref:Gfo/Idh/MocA family protein n=1 Tax=Bacillus sp. FJAT-42376 TaxID=2014076 RepID=UPI000F4D779F|nr:Gfo/Idh/MocA family oxidoreductase [Bacillus sp. FJAT-42376]AZB43036.1 gfo/Idh/MocA family oxidoreductase [Bacillus sp. FJAT-42376]
MLNVAVLSRWHVHADDYVKEALDNENISIKMVWDELEERGNKWAAELGVPYEADLFSVLKNRDIDAVIVCTPTNMHKEVILAAAEYGKHIFSEKVLALSLRDCEEIWDAAEKANVKLMVSLPRLSADYFLYAEEAVKKGWLGRLTSIRCRLAHDGAISIPGKETGWLPPHFFNEEQCGGGALIDLGAHPIYLTNRLAGNAVSVSARLQHTFGLGVDDNAVVTVEYESGALGVLETGFISAESPFQLELYGTEGALLIENNKIRINSSFFRRGEWITPEELPEPLPMPMEQWVMDIQGKGRPEITKNDVFNLTLMNEAAAVSNKEARAVLLQEVKDTVRQANR